MAALLLLHALAHGAIGALPRLFFKRGRLNAAWWLTAAPFLANAPLLVLAQLGLLPMLVPAGSLWGEALAIASVPLALAGVALIAFTLGTHRVPVALWHQDYDAPQHIVTWGAYRRIRHPFYAAFLLILAGAFLFAPSLGTAATLAFGALQLNRTAAGEERRLAASAFGADYRTYVARTGRFLPRLGGAA